MTNSYPEKRDTPAAVSPDRKQPEDKAALTPAVEEILKPEPGGSMEAELTVADADADIRAGNEDKNRAR